MHLVHQIIEVLWFIVLEAGLNNMNKNMHVAFQKHFMERLILFWFKNVPKGCPPGYNWTYISITSSNGLVPYSRDMPTYITELRWQVKSINMSKWDM